MAVTIVILFTVVVILITWWYINVLKFNKYLAKYRGPRPFPIFGNAHRFRSLTDFIPGIMDLQKQFGGVVKIWLGFRPRLFISEPRIAEFLLGSSVLLDKSYEYKYFHSWLGLGLVTSSGDSWKKQRKLLTPTFHFQILEQYVDVFNSQGNVLIEKLRKEVGKKFNICPYISLYTLDAICEAAMGTPVNAQNESESDYVHSVHEMSRIIMERAIHPLKMWDFLYRFFKDYEIEKKALNILHGHTNSVIRKRREVLINKKDATINNTNTGVSKKLAFLDLLLQASIDGETLSDQDIREQVDTLMVAGHHTTAAAISFTLYSLACNPDIQDKVVDELRNIFNDNENRAPSYKDLKKMKYLDMVIKESMRLYPPVPVFARMLVEDINFDNGILPKGLALSVFVYGVHRREELFPNPEKFDPERFSPENSRGRLPYAYLPFSAGARNCIGQKFAVLEIKSTISKILCNFKILQVVEHRPILSTELVLTSANGLLVQLETRYDFY